MFRDDDDLERLREESEARLGNRERREEMTRAHMARANVLTLLAKGGGRKELRAWQIRALLPRGGRPSLAAVRYHLRVLCTARLVGTDDDDPEDPLYRLI